MSPLSLYHGIWDACKGNEDIVNLIWHVGHDLADQAEWEHWNEYSSKITDALAVGFPFVVWLNNEDKSKEGMDRVSPFYLMDTLCCNCPGLRGMHFRRRNGRITACSDCVYNRIRWYINNYIKTARVRSAFKEFEAKFEDYPGPSRHLLEELMEKTSLFDP